MDNEMMYKMFLATISKMDNNELDNTLKKAKELLSDKDYNTLYNMIKKERNGTS